jgi:hypothetical protein
MKATKLFQVAAVTLVAALGVSLSPLTAHAEEPFPGALQEAAELSCAPTCSICHTANPGTAGTWAGKKLGRLIQAGGARIGAGSDAAELKAAYAKVVENANGGNAMAKEVIDSLKAGLDPDTGAEICQVTYGCGAHIVKETPRDDWSGLLFVAGAMGFGALLRRAKRR